MRRSRNPRAAPATQPGDAAGESGAGTVMVLGIIAVALCLALGATG
ncbi:hypothetical protein [Actinomyces ruminis]